METSRLKRVFKWGTKDLEDPDSSLSLNEVHKYFMQQYPELANSYITESKIEGDTVFYEIKIGIGTKG